MPRLLLGHFCFKVYIQHISNFSLLNELLVKGTFVNNFVNNFFYFLVAYIRNFLYFCVVIKNKSKF